MNTRIARIAVNVGCGLSAWYVLALAAGGLLTLLNTCGPRRLVEMLTGVTVYASPVAFVAILAGLTLLFLGSVQFPKRRILAALMICGVLVAIIVLMGCLAYGMRGLGK